jgi:hypothetical protein
VAEVLAQCLRQHDVRWSECGGRVDSRLEHAPAYCKGRAAPDEPVLRAPPLRVLQKLRSISGSTPGAASAQVRVRTRKSVRI